MPGSFVPTVTAITTSQDLQWMVQSTLISSQASGQSGTTGTSSMTRPVPLIDPYDMPGTSYSSGSAFSPPSSDTPGPAPGPIRQSRARSRRTREESVSEDGDVGVLVSVCAWTACLLAFTFYTFLYHMNLITLVGFDHVRIFFAEQTCILSTPHFQELNLE